MFFTKMQFPNPLFNVFFPSICHVSTAYQGFKVYKSSPIGSIDETIPYMIRRAKENNSIIQNSRGDRKLLMKEISSRLLPFVK